MLYGIKDIYKDKVLVLVLYLYCLGYGYWEISSCLFVNWFNCVR